MTFVLGTDIGSVPRAEEGDGEGWHGSNPTLCLFMSDAEDDILSEQLAAEFIRTQLSRLAERSAEVMLRRHPEIAQRFHPAPHDKWRDSFVSRWRDVAEAISVAAPKLFCAQVAWTKAAFAARGVPQDDIRVSLLAMREVTEIDMAQEDRDLVGFYLDQALETLQTAPLAPPPVLMVRSPHGELAARYLMTILEGDRHAACKLLTQATPGVPLQELYCHVILPVMHEMGRMWHLNELSVAEEHFGTATTLMAMSQIMLQQPRKPSVGRTLVAACVQGNTHEIGLRMISDTFELEGWRVVYLGPNVPNEDLATAAGDFQADLVAISATMHSQLQMLADAILLLRQTGKPNLRVLVGGGAMDVGQVWKQIGADGYARSPVDAIEQGAKLCAVGKNLQ